MIQRRGEGKWKGSQTAGLGGGLVKPSSMGGVGQRRPLGSKEGGVPNELHRRVRRAVQVLCTVNEEETP